MKNKIMSWSAATFILSFSILLFSPLLYLIVIGKKDISQHLALGGLEVFTVDSYADGRFGLSYAIGVLIIPVVLSLAVWVGLQLYTRKAGRRGSQKS